MVDEENVVALGLDRSGDTLPVERLKNECSEDEEVESALEKRNPVVLGRHPAQVCARLGRMSTGEWS